MGVSAAFAQERPQRPAPQNNADYKDIDYVGDGLTGHKLDIYIPKDGAQSHKVIVLIYGSAWFSNNSKIDAFNNMGKPLIDNGFAVVSVNHRSSTEAQFPAQINDIKAAIRFVRAKAADYKLDASFIGITGYSSGGHLSSLAGTTNGVRKHTVGSTTVDIEGDLGAYTAYSSNVDAVVDWYGPIDVSRMQDCNTFKDEKAPEAVILGGPSAEKAELGALLNPMTYIDSADPHFLVIHGDADSVVPYCQSAFFSEALDKAGILENFITVPGGNHGPVTQNENTYKAMTDFFTAEAARLQ